MQSDERMDTAAWQVYRLLRIGFATAPVLFGVDKFFNWSVHWPTYLASWVNNIVPGSAQQFMYAVGVVEIIAVVPRIGAPLVSAWLFGIVVNLLTNDPPTFYDIALRDFGLLLGSLALTRLAWTAYASQNARVGVQLAPASPAVRV
jgi:hypothetical protein